MHYGKENKRTKEKELILLTGVIIVSVEKI